MHSESNCLHCGKPFVYPGKGRRSKFCSVACWGFLKNCAWCGVPFWAKANRTIYHNKWCFGQSCRLPAHARTPWSRLSTPTTVEMRFWRNVDRNGPSCRDIGPCWLWTGVVVKDYPKFTVGRKNVGAHRYSWELHNGRAVPDGLWVLHHCDRPLCVNPEHLYAGTPKENARDRNLRSLRCPNCGWHLERGERLRDI